MEGNNGGLVIAHNEDHKTLEDELTKVHDIRVNYFPLLTFHAVLNSGTAGGHSQSIVTQHSPLAF